MAQHSLEEAIPVMTISPWSSRLLLAACVVMALASNAAAQAFEQGGGLAWGPVKDAKLGFMFTVPGRVFKPQAGDPTAALAEKTEKRSGQVFRSNDGRAFLQAAAFANVDRLDIATYKSRVSATYKDAKIDYERMTASFFVVSGQRGQETFYERVYFTCGGRIITAWSMTYPQAESGLYDRIVEDVARSFRPAETSEACAP